MKKLLSLLFCGLLLFSCSDKYDDSALRNDLNDLENRVAKLEELCKQMNTNILSLQKIVDALQDNLSISRVEQISDGYIIHFSDGSTATIKNGKDSGDVPIIGVKKDTDGIYYWTLDGEWLTDENGNQIKAQGIDGEKGDTGDKGETGDTGEKGDTGVTPQLKIENNYWFVSYDNGESWAQLGKATGEDGKDGTNGIFKSVTEDEKNVYFTMADDTVITIPKGDNSPFAIVFDTTDIIILNGGESKTIFYTITGATENTVIKAISQDGWKVKINATSSNEGTITVTAPNPIIESEILVFVNDGSYRTIMAILNCVQGQIIIADNSIDVAAAGGKQEIKLSTNLDYTIEIPKDAQSWLSVAPETRSMREDIITFNFSPNDGDERFATVALKNGDSILQTIIFRQLGTYIEVHVETEGGLEAALTDYDYANIESLRISGELGELDFYFIRNQLPQLRNLDISNTYINEIPSQAFINSKIEECILPECLTTIGEKAFYNCHLTSIIIPANVELIEQSAFQDCPQLSEVRFEQGSKLTTIKGGYTSYNINCYGVFANCTALTYVEIPSNVEVIEAAAFKGCTSLTSVVFEENSNLKIIEGGYDTMYEHLNYGAFTDCTALKSIEIPASVETIGVSAFLNCSQLQTVYFEPNSTLKEIAGVCSRKPHGAFSNCITLSSIEIPSSVTTIGVAAFYGCSNLQQITFEKPSMLNSLNGGGTNSFAMGFDYGTFAQCTSLTTIEIPANIERLHNPMFSGCSNLTTISFAEGSNLKYISSDIYGIYDGTFAQLDKLTTFDASNCTQLISIGKQTFNRNSNLTSLIIGTVVPPTCTDQAFIELNPSLVLKVPSESVAAYKTAPGWKTLSNIEGF